jgi:hypothetical protein
VTAHGGDERLDALGEPLAFALQLFTPRQLGG